MTAKSTPSELKVVYCLTSSGADLYEAMTRVSLATARLTNPTARIEIACDLQTHQALQASGSQLFHEADAVHGFHAPDGEPTFSNRLGWYVCAMRFKPFIIPTLEDEQRRFSHYPEGL